MSTTLPIPKETLADLCDHRAKALDLFQRAVDLLEAAKEEARKASPTDRYVGPGRNEFECLAHWPETFVDKVRENLDRSMWRHMMQASTIGDFMDARARADFAKTLEENPPAATFDNVAATLCTLAAKTPDIVKRGVVELFQRLDRRYNVNRAFKIGHRLKLDSAMTCDTSRWQHWNHYSRGKDELIDLERTLFIADGRKPPEYNATIVSMINAHCRSQDADRFVETDELAVRWFKNGNVDVMIKRADLIETLNGIIADHFGEALPDDRRH